MPLKSGLNVAGVDLLNSNKCPLVMEVNSSPCMQDIEQATGKDVAGMIIKFIQNNRHIPTHFLNNFLRDRFLNDGRSTIIIFYRKSNYAVQKQNCLGY